VPFEINDLTDGSYRLKAVAYIGFALGKIP
jgi:hypothetical protein